MILRCTGNMLALLGARNVAAAQVGEDDWYLNLLWVDGRKCLLLAHAGTAFPVFVADVRKRDLAPLGERVAGTIRRALRAEGLPDDTLGGLDPGEVTITKTASRQLLGFMNDMALHAGYEIADAGGLGACDIAVLNHRLRQTLHNHDGHYATPLDLVTARRERGGRHPTELGDVRGQTHRCWTAGRPRATRR
jgi:hypothetical protein